MFKKILAFVVMLYAAASFAAVDVNKATAAELDGIKGIGPAISAKIVDERKKGNFKDWTDFIDRVKGVGEGNAAKFSAEGLTVGGAGFKGVAAAPAASKKDEKPATAAKAAAPAAATAAAPATAAAKAPAAKEPVAAKEEKKDPKAEAMAKKEADTKAKADEKQAKADAAKAKKEASKDAKPVAKDDKKDAVAESAKPGASAAKK